MRPSLDPNAPRSSAVIDELLACIVDSPVWPHYANLVHHFAQAHDDGLYCFTPSSPRSGQVAKALRTLQGSGIYPSLLTVAISLGDYLYRRESVEPTPDRPCPRDEARGRD